MNKKENNNIFITKDSPPPLYMVWDKVVLLLSKQKIVGFGADWTPITKKALLFCLEPQSFKRIEDAVLKSPGWKIEEWLSITGTARLELREELGIRIDNETSLRYLQSIDSEYKWVVKQLHLVLCDRKGKTINIDNQYSQKKIIVWDKWKRKKVNEILRDIWLTRQELLELQQSQEALSEDERNKDFVTKQVVDLIPTIIDNRKLL